MVAKLASSRKGKESSWHSIQTTQQRLVANMIQDELIRDSILLPLGSGPSKKPTITRILLRYWRRVTFYPIRLWEKLFQESWEERPCDGCWYCE